MTILDLKTPDLSFMSTDDLCGLMLGCGMSRDPSDKAFAAACREELKRRKPESALPAASK